MRRTKEVRHADLILGDFLSHADAYPITAAALSGSGEHPTDRSRQNLLTESVH